MALRLSMFRAMAKAAPKPKTGATRPTKASTAPAVQPPPPAAVPGPSYDQTQAGSGTSGGGIMYQILLGMGSMFGVILAINLVSRVLGPRRITVIHKDSEGRPL
ncbi:unnamed protein product [Cladocopium goreaui]|uniref:Uncharacterized protein n=1 Tax=Cladocopium goreaui TaxID=2562237 RepID=A0A9P1C707_9DINO|nr:unnamed protein product [Cladocopium goreaui]